jgi:hypothetical protein
MLHVGLDLLTSRAVSNGDPRRTNPDFYVPKHTARSCLGEGQPAADLVEIPAHRRRARRRRKPRGAVDQLVDVPTPAGPARPVLMQPRGESS